MTNKNIIGIIINFLVFGLLQVILFDQLVIYNVAFCFFYTGFLLLLPLETDKLLLLLLGFLIGLFVDIFNDTLGVNAAASVALMYFRPYWLALNTPRGGYENTISPDIPSLGLQWFISYAFPLLFLHHAALFFIEAGHFNSFFYQIWKTIVSSCLSLITIIIYQYIFVRKVRAI